VAALMVRHYPQRGNRNEAMMVIGGFLARHSDWSASQIQEVVEAAAELVDQL
jgi:hypothetical protein